MPPVRTLFVVGVSRRDLVESLDSSAREAGFEVEFAATVKDAAEWLDTHDPRAIAVDLRVPGAEAACLRVRGDVRLASVPIIGLAPELDDLVFPEMYGWGGDDVLALAAPHAILPRLRALESKSSLDPSPWKGTTVVADDDRRRRVIMGRVVRNAGYSVQFALDGPEAVAASREADVRLVVAHAELPPDGGVAAAAAARAAGAVAPWVLTAEPKRLAATSASIGGLAKVAVTDAFAPPENVLFVANELGRLQGTDGRATVRLLYGTVVAFRLAGRREEEVGFTYNVSAGGLYVRTLAPISSDDEVWLELTPPRSERLVRLEGKVAWRRAYGPIGSATVPPGFGVRICDGARGDLSRHRAGCAALEHDVLGTPV